MKRKPAGGESKAKPEPVIAPQIMENAKRSVMTDRGADRGKAPGKCVVCTAETPAGASEQLCWVCRRLKISAWREVEQQMPAQE
jgi:hypothetical protein